MFKCVEVFKFNFIKCYLQTNKINIKHLDCLRDKYLIITIIPFL